MILLSIIVLKDKCIEFTDIVNIVNLQEDVTCPKNIRRLLCNFYNIKEEQLVLEDYSPFTNSFVYMWSDDNDTAMSSCHREVICYWNKLRQFEMSKTIEQALDEVVADIKAKQKQNARRLAKIHKLKQENRMLASRRNSLMDKKIDQVLTYGQISGFDLYRYSVKINRISEQIGKNSAKIMRLRTMIKQSKV